MPLSIPRITTGHSQKEKRGKLNAHPQKEESMNCAKFTQYNTSLHENEWTIPMCNITGESEPYCLAEKKVLEAYCSIPFFIYKTETCKNIFQEVV